MTDPQQPICCCWECLLRSAGEGHNDLLRACVAGSVNTTGGHTSGEDTAEVAQDAQLESVSVDAAGPVIDGRGQLPSGDRAVAPGARLPEPSAVRRSAYGAYALQSGIFGIAPLHEMPALQL
jgi:hypothetical protein